MVDLVETTPMAGHLPLVIGTVCVTEVQLGQLTSLAPFAGQDGLLSKALHQTHGVGWPAPGQALDEGDVMALWFGRGQALLVGPVPDAGLAELAAVTDQTDAWCTVEVAGVDAADVLARLVPVDMRPSALGPGRTVRSLLGHMTVSITVLERDRYLILCFRSMAGTLVHDLTVALQAIDARRRLAG